MYIGAPSLDSDPTRGNTTFFSSFADFTRLAGGSISDDLLVAEELGKFETEVLGKVSIGAEAFLTSV